MLKLNQDIFQSIQIQKYIYIANCNFTEWYFIKGNENQDDQIDEKRQSTHYKLSLSSMKVGQWCIHCSVSASLNKKKITKKIQWLPKKTDHHIGLSLFHVFIKVHSSL